MALNQDDSTNIQQLVMSVNPITESFGNAKTIRNNNSSRFGKMIDLFYSCDGYIEGVQISTYLLETVRVTYQLPGERNYRIFYELNAGLDSEKKREWGFENLENFSYINKSNFISPHPDSMDIDSKTDLANYSLLIEALRRIHFSEEEIEHICRAAIGILQLGNINFVPTIIQGADGAEYASESQQFVNISCHLLGLNQDSLYTALTKRQYTIPNGRQSHIEKVLNETAAATARDALARTLYEVLFTRIIDRINLTLNPEGTCSDDHASSISVLDVFGFEYYENNSFEQLCINYANEKLQDYFNYSIFKSQQELYLAEGINWMLHSYPDSTERIDLFENRTTGLLSLCDEILKLSTPNENKLITNFYFKNYKTNPHFTGSKLLENNNEFIICHYACDVKYNVNGWIEKNKSDIALEIKNCILESTNLILKSDTFDLNLSKDNTSPVKMSQLVSVEGLSSPSPVRRKSITITNKIKINSFEQRSISFAMESSPSPKRKSFMSVGKKINTNLSQFSKELTDLIKRIHTMRSHFIRCIKPNATLSPGIFLPEMILSQLRCGGTLQAIQVYQVGFPHKMSFQYFLSRYSVFLCLCGANYVTNEVKDCINRAQLTGQIIYWRLGALRLIDVVRFTMKMLELIEEKSLTFITGIKDIDLQQGLQIGKTSVFLRTNIFEYLESVYMYCVTMIAKKLQRRWRAYQYLKQSAHSTSGSLAMSLLSFTDYKLKKFKRILFSVVIIQRTYRIHTAVKHKKVFLLGMLLLQALYRGHRARQWVWRLKTRSACLIQTKFRKFYYRARYLRMVSSIHILQRNTRKFLASRWKRNVLRAIRLIQRVERGRQTRCRTKLLYEEQVFLLYCILV